MKSNKIPQIRFDEFTDAWEQCALGKLLETAFQGINTAADRVNYSDNGTEILQAKHITTGLVSFEDVRYINKSQYPEYFPKYIPEKGDILFANIGTIGPCAKVTENKEFLVAWNILRMIPKTKESSDFIYTVLQKLNSQGFFEKVTTGNATKFVNKDSMLGIKMMVPDVKEQTKIGSFFSTLDATITFHQRKLDLLVKSKKAYLQKMFPKNGEDKPEIRFAGFIDAWEQCRLGDVAEIVGGGTPSTSNSSFWDGDINWYAPAEIGKQIYVTESIRKITEEGLKSSSAKILPVGTVLFTSRAGIGNTAILKEVGATNQGFQSIIPNENELDTYFIFSRSLELKRYAETVGAGSTFVEVSGKQMAKMPILIPSIDEQTAIGTFFKTLDITITFHQSELELLKKMKQSLLQKMFI